MSRNKIISIVVIVFGLFGLLWFVFLDSSEDSVEPFVTKESLDGLVFEEDEVEIKPSVESDTTEVPVDTTPMKNPIVTVHTTKGDIDIELFMDTMPITAGNFLTLAKAGFYNNIKFHRVIKNFMIQSGDPNSKGNNTAIYGTGGPGYSIEDEFVKGISNIRGTLSMANSGPNTGGSQFFINLIDNTNLDFDKEPLASKHPVFGKVVKGMAIVDAIASVPTGDRDIPIIPVVIQEVVVNE